MGGIYISGQTATAAGGVIAYNVVHDSRAPSGAINVGIYLDAGNYGITVHTTWSTGSNGA